MCARNCAPDQVPGWTFVLNKKSFWPHLNWRTRKCELGDMFCENILVLRRSLCFYFHLRSFSTSQLFRQKNAKGQKYFEETISACMSLMATELNWNPQCCNPLNPPLLLPQQLLSLAYRFVQNSSFFWSLNYITTQKSLKTPNHANMSWSMAAIIWKICTKSKIKLNDPVGKQQK